jgi:hypothetical protein
MLGIGSRQEIVHRDDLVLLTAPEGVAS